MIQDIYPHQLRNEYHPEKKAHSDSPIFVFEGADVLIKNEDRLVIPRRGDFPDDAEAIFLFQVDDVDYFLLKMKPIIVPNGYRFVPVRQIRAVVTEPKELIFATYTAWQLAHWYRDNYFCGTCGSRTVLSKVERALVCPECGRLIYPRIIPAVIVGVTNGDEIVLTRYADRPLAYNALVAGFMEIGETFEQTVEREVMEELGLKVKNLRYYKSQPWAIVDDILAGFYCEVDGDLTIHRNPKELKSAIWTRREDIVLQPDDYSLTNEMMREFKEGRQ